MLVGLISDTHNQTDRTRRAVALLTNAGAETIIHCGDFTRPELIAVCAVRPLYLVIGNNDDPAELTAAAREAGANCLGWGGEVTLAGRRIAVTHGHRAAEVRHWLAAEPAYLLSGHSHCPGEHCVGNVRCINPGALHRASQYSVAVLDLLADELRFLTVPR